MPAGLEFWGIAAAVAFGSLALVFGPLLRGARGAERRASYDMQVYRDQLGEVEAEVARGVLTEGEAAATRAEVARRLLAAADAEAAETAAGAAPRWLSRLAGPALVAALALAAGGLYTRLGAPGLPDQPLAERRAREAAAWAGRPGQAAAEAIVLRSAPAPPAAGGEDAALVAQLEAVLRAQPDDLDGHRMLARRLGALGRWPEARAAQARVVELLGAEAGPQDVVDLAEIMVLAANGYVSPEAEAALQRALALQPAHPVGRYYSGLALMQGGRPDLAYRLWTGLLAEGPPDAPWIAAIEAEIGEVARLANLPPPAGARGPGAADLEAAAEMAPEERQAMIEGMVDQLAQRLAAEGGAPADWAQLIRSLGVLGRTEAAGAIRSEARTAFAGDAAALAQIEDAARAAGLGP